MMSETTLSNQGADGRSEATEKAVPNGFRILPVSAVEDEHDEYRRHGFRIGDTGLLIPPDMVCEISNSLSLSRMPNSPGWLYGLVNLRGNIVPVLDLTVLLNIFKSGRSQKNQLFFQVDNDWIGIVANGLPRPLSLPPENKMEKLPAMPWELRPYVNSCYKKDGTWFDCDLRAIFAWVEKYMHS